jgi:hypothetical protein
MKILIKENRIQSLANHMLDEKFGELYEYVDYTTDSTGEWKITFYSKEGKNVIIYRHDSEYLYIAEEYVNSLDVFAFNIDENDELIKDWFQSRYELPVREVVIYGINTLNS